MSALSDTSLSLLSQSASPTPPWTFTSNLLLTVAAVAGSIYFTSPTRLTSTLVSALAQVENKYLAGVENGVVLSAEVDIAERLAVLQLKVSTLRETSLRSTLSIFSTLYHTLNISRSVAVLRCLAEVRGLDTYIEISHETQLREITSASEAHCRCPLSNRAGISLRRRRVSV